MNEDIVNAPSTGPSPRRLRNTLIVATKALISLIALAYIYKLVFGREGFAEVQQALATLRWSWFAAAVVMQLLAISCGIARWRMLLAGQGLRAPWPFLAGSWMIGRFWGAVTPGGLGLDGWRLYETVQQTGKVARAVAVSGVEKILGQLGFGAVVVAGSTFGFQFIGLSGVLWVNAFFVGLVSVGLTLLARPQAFRALSRVLPRRVQDRIESLVDAVCAYHGKWRLLAVVALLSMGVHAFNNFIYVCAARALGIELSVGVVFFGSSLQILATILPGSINGIGLREAAAVALYTSPAVGLSATQALLIPTIGFAAEMLVSACGMPIFLLRRGKSTTAFVVDAPDRERPLVEHVEVPSERWPRVRRAASLGLGGGLLGGTIVGIAEAFVVLTSSSGSAGVSVLAYGGVAYGLSAAVLSAAACAAAAAAGRAIKREAYEESSVYARTAAAVVALCGFGLTAFRIRRDVFREDLEWKSMLGVGVLVACLLGAALAYGALVRLLQSLTSRRRGSLLLRTWGTPAVAATLVAALILASRVSIATPDPAPLRESAASVNAGRGNVIVLVVDTLRADHLSIYGYPKGSTPNLEAFARDSVRFDQAFANASWTRPSFASILTGRYPSSHGVMAKSDALPDAVVTMAESFAQAGYQTGGFATNYNVAPYFNFQQGFDYFQYLEPEFVLWADDYAAKLLLVQFARQRIETLRDRFLGVQPGTAYRDAETVNAAVLRWIEAAPRNPWFLFVGYMDPHDPYFRHPYDGAGYSRAAHPNPRLEEADTLRALYDGEVTYWDRQFGALIRELRRRGLYDEATILVTSDHGEEFGEHNGFWHGTTLYDEIVRLPLLVKLPGGRLGGTSVRHWVQSIDIMPTLLGAAGVPIPAEVQGANLFGGGASAVYAEESHEGNVLHSVRTRRGVDDWKLITANAGNPRGLAQVELFRVSADPGEQHNLAEDEQSTLEQARSTLDEQQRTARTGRVERQEVEMDATSRRQLCELGYLRDSDCE
jgi:arylsulfatase A-like enzyme/uncharacterized membrane protein YbhN (UPF0104 family)